MAFKKLTELSAEQLAVYILQDKITDDQRVVWYVDNLIYIATITTLLDTMDPNTESITYEIWGDPDSNKEELIK